MGLGCEGGIGRTKQRAGTMGSSLMRRGQEHDRRRVRREKKEHIHVLLCDGGSEQRGHGS